MFDGEDEPPSVDGCNGKRVFFALEGAARGSKECELPGDRTDRNGRFHGNERHASTVFRVHHPRIHGFRATRPRHEEHERRDATDDRNRDVEKAVGREKVIRIHQAHGVDREYEEDDGEEFVGREPPGVTQALQVGKEPERDHEHGEPQARRFGKRPKGRPQCVEPFEYRARILGFRGRRHGERREDRADPGLDKPVNDGEDDRGDAETAMPEVEGVERRLHPPFDPRGARGDDERQGHPKPGDRARHIENLVNDRSGRHLGRNDRKVDRPKQDGKKREARNNGRGSVFGGGRVFQHGRLLFGNRCPTIGGVHKNRRESALLWGSSPMPLPFESHFLRARRGCPCLRPEFAKGGAS